MSNVTKTTNIDKDGKIRKIKDLVTGNCVFPFRYKKENHYECIPGKYGNWCATSLKPNGTYNTWGICIDDEEKEKEEVLKSSSSQSNKNTKKQITLKEIEDMLKSSSSQSNKHTKKQQQDKEVEELLKSTSSSSKKSNKSIPSPPKKETKKKIIIRKKKQAKTQEDIMIHPEQWILTNRKGFSNWFDSTFSKYRLDESIVKETKGCGEENKEELDLFPYQKIVRDYLSLYSPYRGILIYHGLGSGKTCASIAIAEGMKTERNIIVMLPASLRSNYIGQLKHCGDLLWKLNQHWTFESITNQTELNNLFNLTNIDKKIIRKNGGCWIIDKTKKENYSTLSNNDKKQINEQIDYLISQKYRFINYNGLQTSHLNEMEQLPENPFNNKLVIIDEVHNLISRVIGGGIGLRLYNLLMNAKNLRLVLLSGTPIINYAYESAVLLNLVRGYIKSYHMKIKLLRQTSKERLTKILENHPEIDQVFIDDKLTNIEITRNPYFFINERQNMLKIQNKERNIENDEVFIRNINRYLLQNHIKISNTNTVNNLALPNDEQTFNHYFIEKQNNQLKNQDLFMKRILGLVSHYKGERSDLYPRTSGMQVINVPMSDYQFQKYEEIRRIEREKERTNKKIELAKKKKKDKEDTISSYYRVFSRAFGNFVFPETIERPLPNKKVEDKIEINEEDGEDDIDINFDEEEQEKQQLTKNKIYENQKTKALQDLRQNSNEYLTIPKLRLYSPKYVKIIENINSSPGTVFVYSQFRSLEGVGILGLALEANGYAPFRIRQSTEGNWEIYEEPEDIGKMKYAYYTGTENEEHKNIILNIFNHHLDKLPPNIRKYIESKGGNMYGNVIKILMATSSAAEGINLQNVRQVHIMEPYWNPVRIDQVMGRAVRTCSHSRLPEIDRHVDIFFYVATFTKSQLDSSFTIKIKDKGLTTDETIFNIANNKKQILGGLLTLMKSASIDCSLNSYENEPVKCFSFSSQSNPAEYSFVPNINKEYTDPFSQVKSVALKGIKIRFPPKTGDFYILNPDTKQIYDYESWINATSKGGRPIIIGKLINKDGKQTIEFNKK